MNLILVGGAAVGLLNFPHMIPVVARKAGVLLGSAYRVASGAQKMAGEVSSKPEMVALRKELSAAFSEMEGVRMTVKEGEYFSGCWFVCVCVCVWKCVLYCNRCLPCLVGFERLRGCTRLY